MTMLNARLVYPASEIPLVMQSSLLGNEFYGLDKMQCKKLKIVLAKFGCKHTLHVVPDHVSLDMHRFIWNEKTESFEVEMNKTVDVQLNTLEEAIVGYQYYQQQYY